MRETYYNIAGCPFSLALLTDTHDGDPEPVLASVRAHAPAFIALAGDFVCGMIPWPGAKMEKSKNALKLLTACASLAPTFVSLGNHEAYLPQSDLEIVRATGVTLLDNRYVTLDIGGRRAVVGGLSSGYFTYYRKNPIPSSGFRHPKSPAPELGWLEGYAAEDGYHILLMHHPEYIRLIPRSIELALSGHAHGGQWRFYDLRAKRWRGLYAPDQGLFPKLTEGVVDGRQVISRGLGNTSPLPRLLNGREIIYIDGGISPSP